MEDHGGALVLEDAPVAEGWESGARVRLVFPRRRLVDGKEKQKTVRNADRVAGDVTEEAVDGV